MEAEGEPRLLLESAALGIMGALSARLFMWMLGVCNRFLLYGIAGYNAPGMEMNPGLTQRIGPHGLWLIPAVTTLGVAVEQAETVAKVAGKLPQGVVRALEASQAAKVDWRELPRRAWSDTIPADYSWTRPNRRHVWAGLYIPGLTSEGVGEIAIAVDCSGSVGARQLGLFEAEIRSILAGQRPRLVHVLYFDAAVQKVETHPAGQPVSLSPVGGGGTDFRPCFEWLDEQGILPQTLVSLTDLCGAFPSEAPPYPVIWASTEMRRAPFGEIVPMGGA